MGLKMLAVYAVEFVLSPTYFFADYKKSKRYGHAEDVGNLIKRFNAGYLIIACLIAFGLYSYPPTDIYKSQLGGVFIWVAAFIVWAYPLSRANEIIYAFYRDAIEKLNGEASRSNLKYGERIKLAVKSYVELIVNFACIYILLPADFFVDGKVHSFIDALYFSGVTMTTLGYGDIVPAHAVTRFFAIYEVVCGFSLIIVSFAVYTGRGIEFNARGQQRPE